jgi:dCTP diphosphatase
VWFTNTQREATPAPACERRVPVPCAGEVGELLSLLQWKTEEQSDQLSADERVRVTDELADVAMYLLLLAGRVGVDLGVAVRDKLVRNDVRYPVEKSRGSSLKHDQL